MSVILSPYACPSGRKDRYVNNYEKCHKSLLEGLTEEVLLYEMVGMRRRIFWVENTKQRHMSVKQPKY